MVRFAVRVLLATVLVAVLVACSSNDGNVIRQGGQKLESLLYTPDQGDDHLLFTSFRHKEEKKLYLLYSRNGFAWRELGPVLTVKEAGLRDPMIARGPDGVYHAVWTVGRRRIGHASSRDLIEWSAPRLIDLMVSEPGSRNTWAPELFYDRRAGEWLVLFSSTVEGRFAATRGGDGWNNRIYVCTTRDFREFSKPVLFFDPGYPVIDAALMERGGRYYLFYKNETVGEERLAGVGRGAEAGPATTAQGAARQPVGAGDAGGAVGARGEPGSGGSPDAAPAVKAIYHDYIEYAESDSPRGPWTNIRRAVDLQGIEGPAPIDLGTRVIVYYDHFDAGRYGAMVSTDMNRWIDKTNAMTFPEGHRHGSVLRVPPAIAQRLIEHTQEARP